MKKLLTVSVFAIMAVSAANANIASTEYVDKQTGSENGVFAAGSFTNAAAEATNLKDAVNAIAGAVGTTNANLDALDGSFTDPGVVTSITQTDGKVTATLKRITDAEVDSISTDKITGLGALAEKDTVALGEVEGLTGELAGKQDNISDLQAIREGAALGATSLQDDDVATTITQDVAQAGKLATSGLVAKAFSEFNTDLSSELTDINDTLREIPNTYAPINTVEAAEETAINNAAKAITDTIGTGFAAGNTVADQLSDVKDTADNAAKSIGEMDATYAAQDGKYIASVTQADGKVTATYADLTDVAKMEVPDVCNGTATCALVWNKTTQKLDWEAIMQ